MGSRGSFDPLFLENHITPGEDFRAILVAGFQITNGVSDRERDFTCQAEGDAQAEQHH